MPLVWLLHAENSTVFGHVIYGVLLARFPAYLPKVEPARREPPAAERLATEQPGETTRPDPDLS